MDLAALGLPMEQVRNVWLVAFFIYLACCLLVEVAYPTLIGASRAREVYTSVMGSPVEDVKEAITELADAGTHLTPEQEEAAFRRAEANWKALRARTSLWISGISSCTAGRVSSSIRRSFCTGIWRTTGS